MENNNEDKTIREKEYNRIKLRIMFVDIAIDIVLLTLFAFSGVSSLLYSWIERFLQGDYARFFAFIFSAGAIFSAVSFPLSLYGGYFLEHRFGLSNQSIFAYFWEKIKASAVGLAIGVPVSFAFYFFLRSTGDFWWLYFALFAFTVSALLAAIAPVLIFPIFYKFKELEDGPVKERITALMKDKDIEFRGIFTFNMSRDTNKANAGFAGIGRTKRIILSDTLIEKFTPDEIAVVFAHEVGHYKKRHIIKNLGQSFIMIFLSFYLCNLAYANTLKAMGFSELYQIPALPVLLFYLMIFSLLAMPLSNYISRAYEREADTYAIAAAGGISSFVSAMEKLADMNLSDRDPHPAVEFLFYSHPSIRKRIEVAKASAA